MSKKIKILITDDEVKFLDSISQRLELRDFDVTKASNGKDAIEAAKNNKFELALLDLKMPEMDGKQVLQILKQEHKFIEVVILTGHGSMDSAVECTKLGAFGYLPKPYELDKLIETLKSAYEMRMKKKFENDQAKMDTILKMATGGNPLGILRKMKELDDDVT
ncbi:MAG: response regulator [Fibrobacteria bacterium]|nr:response regulator [Fibrobacteria bacterium]